VSVCTAVYLVYKDSVYKDSVYASSGVHADRCTKVQVNIRIGERKFKYTAVQVYVRIGVHVLTPPVGEVHIYLYGRRNICALERSSGVFLWESWNLLTVNVISYWIPLHGFQAKDIPGRELKSNLSPLRAS